MPKIKGWPDGGGHQWHFILDEIGNLSLPMQSKLLTAIEKRQISRLGSTQAVPIDVRLIVPQMQTFAAW